jgi:RHS repeat-associated protein
MGNVPSPVYHAGYSSSTNHVTGATYDSNGNMTFDGGVNHYGWDAYSKLSSINQTGTNCATSGVCLTYDALGRVAEKKTGSAYTQILYSPLGKTAVMSGQTLSYAYIPLPGGMTEYKTSNSMYRLWHKDWIDNARVVADLNGTIQEGTAYSPYGEIEFQNIYGTVTNEFSFTGDTQDLTAGLFDTPMRELNQSEGRWISPDPAGASWNAYAYPTNPNIATDPTGAMQFYHTDCYCSGNGSGFDPGDSAVSYSNAQDLEYAAGDAWPTSNKHMASQQGAASGDGAASGQSQSSGCGWCQKLINGVRGAGWKTDRQIAQEAIDRGDPPNGEYHPVFGRSCPDCKYYSKEVVEAVDAHEDQHAKDEHTWAGFKKLFSKQGQRDLEINAFKAELSVENRNIGALEAKGSARTPMDEKSLIILRNMRDEAQGVIDTGAKIYIP